MTVLVLKLGINGKHLAQLLTTNGIATLHSELITFIPGTQLSFLKTKFSKLRTNDCVIALSPQAVHYANMEISHMQWPSYLNYLAIGATTAAVLEEHCRQHVHYPQSCSTSEALLNMPILQNISARKVLLLRGNGGRKILNYTLSSRGATVMSCQCYKRVLIPVDSNNLLTKWCTAKITCIAVTSGQILCRLYALQKKSWLMNCALIVISERLAKIAYRLGWSKVIIADGPDFHAISQAVIVVYHLLPNS